MVEVRPARAQEAGAIRALVRAERLNPTGLDWRRFHVAVEAGEVVGAVQVRPRGPELSSLVVRPDRRGQGIGGRLVGAALAGTPGPVFLVAPRGLAGLYARHGFAPVPLARAPGAIVRELLVGQLAGSLFALLTARRPRRLVAMGARPHSQATSCP